MQRQKQRAQAPTITARQEIHEQVSRLRFRGTSKHPMEKMKVKGVGGLAKMPPQGARRFSRCHEKYFVSYIYIYISYLQIEISTKYLHLDIFLSTGTSPDISILISFFLQEPVLISRHTLFLIIYRPALTLNNHFL